MKYRCIYLILGLSLIFILKMFLVLPTQAQTRGVEDKIDFNAIIADNKIKFSIKNESSDYILFDDDFCLLTKMHTYLLRPDGQIIHTPYFQQAFIRPNANFLKLKPGQDFSCSIESSDVMRKYSGHGLIIWQTKFFLATGDGQYQTLLRNGTFQVGDGLGVVPSSDLDLLIYKKETY